MAPLFSIVIPNYNYAQLLPRAVESACRQPGDDYEVLIIDDGSTDDSRAVLEDLLEKFPDTLRIHCQANAGVAAARNRGIEMSRGRFVLLFDADDELLPEALMRFRESIAANPAATVHIAPTQTQLPGGKLREGAPPVIAGGAEQRVRDYLFKATSIAHGGVLAIRELLVEYGYPDLPQSEDIPVFVSLLAHGTVATVSLPTARVYKHQDSRRRNLAAGFEAGEKLVAELFDSGRLPKKYGEMRSRYLASRMLSLFKRSYREKEWLLARNCFELAWGACVWSCLREPRQLLKYATCRIRR